MSYASALAAFTEADKVLAEVRHIEASTKRGDLWAAHSAVREAHAVTAKAHRSLALLIRRRVIQRLETRGVGLSTVCRYRTTQVKLEAWSAWTTVGVGMMDRTVEIDVRVSLKPVTVTIALIACFDLDAPIGVQLDAAADAVKRVLS